MISCTNKELQQFSHEHYTYINQIFGDEGVRDVIQEMYPSKEWKLIVEDATEEFGYSNHHRLEKKGKKGETIKWCSLDEGIQNLYINENDTLCQSYSLLKYLNKPIKKDMKERQIEMIKMYKNIIEQQTFKDELCGMIELMQDKIKDKIKDKNEKYDEDNSIWQDHTYNTRPPLMIDFDTLYCNIQAVLEKWEKFGYLYFIKDGKCPKK